jgi:hypothetical protein
VEFIKAKAHKRCVKSVDLMSDAEISLPE